MQVRVLVSSADAPRGWDLRCRVREALIDFLQRRDPEGLPRVRAVLEPDQPPAAATPASRDAAGVGDSTAIRDEAVLTRTPRSA